MKILIAEDDEALQSAMASKFQAAGYETVLCKDGVECLEILNTQDIDAIMLDIVMPNMDGYEFLEKRKGTKNENIPVYVVTNLGREEDCQKAKSLGAKECFVKSAVSLKDVIGCVQKDVSA
jgi:CheY-like chemotaxis protein